MAAFLDYDARIIEQAAERLYGKAAAVVAGSIAIGVVVGAAFGCVPLTSLGASWPIPSGFGFATLLLGAVLGGVIGYVVGDARAFGYKLQAQTTLCQLQIERNTAAAASAAERLNAAAARAATALGTDLAAPAAAPAAAPPAAAPAPPVAATPLVRTNGVEQPPLSPPLSA